MTSLKVVTGAAEAKLFLGEGRMRILRAMPPLPQKLLGGLESEMAPAPQKLLRAFEDAGAAPEHRMLSRMAGAAAPAERLRGGEASARALYLGSSVGAHGPERTFTTVPLLHEAGSQEDDDATARAAALVKDVTNGKSIDEIAAEREMTREDVIAALRAGSMTVTITAPTGENGDIQTTEITDTSGRTVTEYYDYQHDSYHSRVTADGKETDDLGGGTVQEVSRLPGGVMVERTTTKDGKVETVVQEPGGKRTVLGASQDPSPKGSEEVVAAVGAGKTLEDIAREKGLSVDQVRAQLTGAGYSVATSPPGSQGEVEWAEVRASNGSLVASSSHDWQHGDHTTHHIDPNGRTTERTVDKNGQVIETVIDKDGKVTKTVTTPVPGQPGATVSVSSNGHTLTTGPDGKMTLTVFPGQTGDGAVTVPIEAGSLDEALARHLLALNPGPANQSAAIQTSAIEKMFAGKAKPGLEAEAEKRAQELAALQAPAKNEPGAAAAPAGNTAGAPAAGNAPELPVDEAKISEAQDAQNIADARLAQVNAALDQGAARLNVWVLDPASKAALDQAEAGLNAVLSPHGYYWIRPTQTEVTGQLTAANKAMVQERGALAVAQEQLTAADKSLGQAVEATRAFTEAARLRQEAAALQARFPADQPTPSTPVWDPTTKTVDPLFLAAQAKAAPVEVTLKLTESDYQLLLGNQAMADYSIDVLQRKLALAVPDSAEEAKLKTDLAAMQKQKGELVKFLDATGKAIEHYRTAAARQKEGLAKVEALPPPPSAPDAAQVAPGSSQVSPDAALLASYVSQSGQQQLNVAMDKEARAAAAALLAEADQARLQGDQALKAGEVDVLNGRLVPDHPDAKLEEELKKARDDLDALEKQISIRAALTEVAKAQSELSRLDVQNLVLNHQPDGSDAPWPYASYNIRVGDQNQLVVDVLYQSGGSQITQTWYLTGPLEPKDRDTRLAELNKEWTALLGNPGDPVCSPIRAEDARQQQEIRLNQATDHVIQANSAAAELKVGVIDGQSDKLKAMLAGNSAEGLGPAATPVQDPGAQQYGALWALPAGKVPVMVEGVWRWVDPQVAKTMADERIALPQLYEGQAGVDAQQLRQATDHYGEAARLQAEASAKQAGLPAAAPSSSGSGLADQTDVVKGAKEKYDAAKENALRAEVVALYTRANYERAQGDLLLLGAKEAVLEAAPGGPGNETQLEAVKKQKIALSKQVEAAATDSKFHTAHSELAQIEAQGADLEQQLLTAFTKDNPTWKADGYGEFDHHYEIVEEGDGQLYLRTYGGAEEVKLTHPLEGGYDYHNAKLDELNKQWQALVKPKQQASQSLATAPRIGSWGTSEDFEGQIAALLTDQIIKDPRGLTTSAFAADTATDVITIAEQPTLVTPAAAQAYWSKGLQGLSEAGQPVGVAVDIDDDGNQELAWLDPVQAVKVLALDREQQGAAARQYRDEAAAAAHLSGFMLTQPLKVQNNAGNLQATYLDEREQQALDEIIQPQMQALYKKGYDGSFHNVAKEDIAGALQVDPDSKAVDQVLEEVRKIGGANASVAVIPIFYANEDVGFQQNALFAVKNERGDTRYVDAAGMRFSSIKDFQHNNRLYAESGKLVVPVNLEMAIGADGKIALDVVKARKVSTTEKVFDPVLGAVTGVLTLASFSGTLAPVAAPLAYLGAAILAGRTTYRQQEYISHGGEWGDRESVMNMYSLLATSMPNGSSTLRTVGMTGMKIEQTGSRMTAGQAFRASIGATRSESAIAVQARTYMQSTAKLNRLAWGLDAAALGTGAPLLGLSAYDLAVNGSRMSDLERANAIIGLGAGAAGTGLGIRSLRYLRPGTGDSTKVFRDPTVHEGVVVNRDGGLIGKQTPLKLGKTVIQGEVLSGRDVLYEQQDKTSTAPTGRDPNNPNERDSASAIAIATRPNSPTDLSSLGLDGNPFQAPDGKTMIRLLDEDGSPLVRDNRDPIFAVVLGHPPESANNVQVPSRDGPPRGVEWERVNLPAVKYDDFHTSPNLGWITASLPDHPSVFVNITIDHPGTRGERNLGPRDKITITHMHSSDALPRYAASELAVRLLLHYGVYPTEKLIGWNVENKDAKLAYENDRPASQNQIARAHDRILAAIGLRTRGWEFAANGRGGFDLIGHIDPQSPAFKTHIAVPDPATGELFVRPWIRGGSEEHTPQSADRDPETGDPEGRPVVEPPNLPLTDISAGQAHPQPNHGPQHGERADRVEAPFDTAALAQGARVDGQPIDRRSLEKAEWQRFLDRTLESGPLPVRLQELRNRDNRIVGYEALLGTIGGKWPNEIIPHLEEHGLIPVADRAMVEAVAAILCQHKEIPNIAVNLSSYSLNDGTIADFVRTTCAAYSVKPERLSIEITETGDLPNFQVAEPALTSLAAMGHKLKIDDFGQGRSLGYIEHLPADLIDAIKIDMKYVRMVELDPANAEHVSRGEWIDLPSGARLLVDPKQLGNLEAVVPRLQEHNIEVIAEGVETSELGELLVTRIGVDQLQGFALHKPQLAEEVDFGSLLLPEDVGGRGAPKAPRLMDSAGPKLQRESLNENADGAPDHRTLSAAYHPESSNYPQQRSITPAAFRRQEVQLNGPNVPPAVPENGLTIEGLYPTPTTLKAMTGIDAAQLESSLTSAGVGLQTARAFAAKLNEKPKAPFLPELIAQPPHSLYENVVPWKEQAEGPAPTGGQAVDESSPDYSPTILRARLPIAAKQAFSPTPYHEEPTFLFRGETRDPYEIFHDGFTEEGRPDPYGVISTSLSATAAKVFARGVDADGNLDGTGGWLYTIVDDVTDADIVYSLPVEGRYHPIDDYEIRFSGEIPAENILAARQVDADGRLFGPAIYNSGFHDPLRLPGGMRLTGREISSLWERGFYLANDGRLHERQAWHGQQEDGTKTIILRSEAGEEIEAELVGRIAPHDGDQVAIKDRDYWDEEGNPKHKPFQLAEVDGKWVVLPSGRGGSPNHVPARVNGQPIDRRSLGTEGEAFVRASHQGGMQERKSESKKISRDLVGAMIERGEAGDWQGTDGLIRFIAANSDQGI
ncbi:EAL domain-containing protein, partial [Mesorhizobium sp.]|uniref:EAL domain-containing protein n=1 Tax=Mesorhizobium sp. TaxID=1871066 RepID=UPI00120E01C9